MTSAVHQLTIDPVNLVDHMKELEDVAKLLSRTRIDMRVDSQGNFQETKEKLNNCKNMDEIVSVLANTPFVRSQFSLMEQSSILEEMLGLCRSYKKGPLNSFPPNINRNLYADVVRFGLQHAPKLLSLLVDLQTDKDKCISPQNVIKIGFHFSQLAVSVNDKLSTVSKVKCLGLKSGGLSKEALDTAAVSGMTQSSRCVAEQRDFLAGISWELIATHSKKYPHQSTMDNLDFNRNGILHHMTLAYIEIEQECTNHLSTKGMSYEETLNLFSPDLLLINSERNREAKEQIDKVVAITLGRIFAREIPELKWMLKLLPNHYNSQGRILKPSVLLTKKPLYLQETKNTDIVKIVQQEQLDFLRLVGEQVLDKDAFMRDLDTIRDKESDEEVRVAAENRVHAAAKSYGEFIGHGDLLTCDRFYIAKRLRRSAVTAYERLDYVKYFRPELFHMKLNKVQQDYGFTMKSDINAADELSLGWFNGFLQMSKITNEAAKIKKPGLFELHDQFYMAVGEQYLVNGFKTYIKDFDITAMTKDFIGCKGLVLDFLKKTNIEYFFNVESSDKEDVFDDLMDYVKDVCGRTVLSLVFDKMEEEADSLGLHALRIVMIPYFLARKEKQDSKYAATLLTDLVMELSASPRTRERMNQLVCVNPNGKPGEAIARDKRCEHEVRRAKEEMRGLHGPLRDSLVEKRITGQNALHLILEHDRESLLLNKISQSSYDYVGPERRKTIAEQLDKVEPFSKSRSKVSFKEKSSGSVFSNMTLQKLERFVSLKKSNFNRNCTQKNKW